MGQLRAVAAGVRGSFSSIARNYDGTYSAQRQELVEAQEGYAILQDNFIAAVSRPVYRRWLATAITAGVIDVPTDTDMATLFNAVYSGPVMPWIDPLKEANARRILIRGGAATESDWVRARGGAPAEVKRRRKAEIDENRKLGLVFDTDPAHDPGNRIMPEVKTTVAAIKMPPVMTAGNGRGEGSSNSWYSIRAAANNTAEVRIYDEIGGWGISARWFAEELAALGQINRINLHIHSPAEQYWTE